MAVICNMIVIARFINEQYDEAKGLMIPATITSVLSLVFIYCLEKLFKEEHTDKT